MINTYKTFATKTLIVAFAVSFVLGMNYLYAAWSPPGANPPAGNTYAPINVSGTAQDKAGSLSVGGVFLAGSSANIAGRLDVGGVFLAGSSANIAGRLDVGGAFVAGSSANIAGRLGVGGNLDIGGWFRTTKGTVAAGNVLTSDASGYATWQAPSGGGTVVSGQNGHATFPNGLKIKWGRLPAGTITATFPGGGFASASSYGLTVSEEGGGHNTNVGITVHSATGFTANTEGRAVLWIAIGT